MARVMFAGFFLLRIAMACSCVGLATPCNRQWKPANTAFLGKVSSIQETGETGFLSVLAVRFDVAEAFKETAAPGQEMVVYTGRGGGDCGYPFVPGETYLVYAERGIAGDLRLHTGICSPTTPVVRAGGMLRELRAWRDHQRLDDVFGAVLQEPVGGGYADLVESKPLSGVTVRAAGADGRESSTTTGPDGAYAFPVLPPGSYVIRAEAPPGLALLAREEKADVREDGSGCAVDQSTKPDGRIAGVVVDTAGNLQPGFVTIQPADPGQAEEARRRGGLPGYEVGSDGKFVLPFLPPGRYRLLFHPQGVNGVAFRISYYWPSDASASLELGLGEHLDKLRFLVPAR